MTHSTLTWFSSSIEPKENEQFLVALYYGREDGIKPFPYLATYNKETDVFECHLLDGKVQRYKRGFIQYWAYVPIVLDFKREGKQSQVPEEK